MLRDLAVWMVVLALCTSQAQAQTETDAEAESARPRVGAFIALGPSFVQIDRDDGTVAGEEVGPQFGFVSLSIELRLLFAHRFGLALTPLTWQPSGGVQNGGDHWRFVRVGGGLRFQALAPSARAQLRLGYDLSYLRATDVQYCIDCSESEERSRTIQSLGHSLSLRLDTPLRHSAVRIGGRLEAGIANDATMAWVSVGVSLGFGQRVR